MTARDVREIKMDDSDLSLEQEDCPMLAPQVIYDSAAGQQGTSSRNCTPAIKSHSLDQCGTSLSGLDLHYASPQSIDQKGYAVQEFKVEKNKSVVLDTVDFPRRKVPLQLRGGQWSHLYQLADGSKQKGLFGDPLSGAKNKLMGGIIENSKKGNVNTWHLRNLETKHNDETRVFIDVVDIKNSNSENTLLPQEGRLKINSTSSFSHFFGNKTSKGKGIICGHPGDKSNFDNGTNFKSNDRLFSALGMTSGAQMQLQHSNNRMVFDSNRDGISLREWLKPGQCTKNKVEGLNFFWQIAGIVNLAHSQGVVLQHLRPSYFKVMTSNKLQYIGSSTQIGLDVPISQSTCGKRPGEEDIYAFYNSDTKQQKLLRDMKIRNHPSLSSSRSGLTIATLQDTNYDLGCSSSADYVERSLSSDQLLEEKWYTCPEEIGGKGCKFSSNIYSLGVLLFELLCPFDSLEAHSAAIFDMHHRILPPLFLSGNPKEAGFCLWLIHPEPSSRPTIREILLSDLFHGSQELHSTDELPTFSNDDHMAESALLLDFLVSSKDQKQDSVVKLVEDIRCIESDIKGLEGKPFSTAYPKKEYNLQNFISSVARSSRKEARLINDMSQLEKSYFSMRSQTTVTTGAGRADKDLLKNRETWSHVQKHNEVASINQKSPDGLGVFFDDLCKFTCYSKLELCGTLRNSDLLNSTNVICSLSFDRDEEYIAIAGVSKKIKIFDFSALVSDTIDIHYPVIEMGNKSKLSCISWNTYIKNYLASTDYDGIIQVWDASTGVGLSQHIEHEKRAWSVDFSRLDPTKFASGSDDCSVKLWCTNEKRSISTIWSPANVCCVQFSPYSSHLLAFGCADYKIYGYDLRHTKIPWCTLAGHEKAVSFVKFIDSETFVSASTDNTLKLWDLNKTSLSGLSSDACHLTFSGHTNKKHFVGLSVRDGYIACGSESNEVFLYYRSLPMPITSYKFTPVDPIARHEVGEDNGLFVSSVCWRSKSNVVVAANSGGTIRLLQMV